MEEGVPVGIRPLTRQMGRTLVPPSATPSPGANCNSATSPLPAPYRQAPLHQLRPAVGDLPHAAQVPPGTAYTSPKL